MSTAAADDPARLGALADEARAARTRLRARPLSVTIEALAEAAARWRRDPALVAGLPEATRLSPPLVARAIAIAADAIDAAAMHALVERELGAGAAGRPAADGPALVGHVLAGNVPALALPAIALGCLVGASVVVKSGRGDRLSAPAFHRALAAVDPDLAATVVTTYWSGGDAAAEEAAFAHADVVVASGGDEATRALADRLGPRLVAHAERWSVAALSRERLAQRDGFFAALASDVALHDQRGCLSPHAVYVEVDDPRHAREFAERLAAALDALADELPPGPASVEERAALHGFAAEAEWDATAAVHVGRGGVVVCDERPVFRPGRGLRTVRVHPLSTLSALPIVLPAARIECVGLGVAGPERAALVPALRRLGVARICEPGRMQHPPLGWPRGQRAPLGALLGRTEPPRLEVET